MEDRDENEWPAWVQGIFGALLFILVLFADAFSVWLDAN